MVSIAIGSAMTINSDQNNGNVENIADSMTNQDTVSDIKETQSSTGIRILNEVCPGDPTVYPVIINKLDVYDTNDFYDLNDRTTFSGKTEAENRIAAGHNVVQLPAYSSEYIYFLDDGSKVCGPRLKVMYEAEGKTTLASVSAETFLPYSTAPSNFWKIENGYFVKVHPIEDVDLLQELRKELSQKQNELASTNYQFQKYVDGVLTEEEYAPIKAQRVQLYADIDLIQAQIAELMK